MTDITYSAFRNRVGNFVGKYFHEFYAWNSVDLPKKVAIDAMTVLIYIPAYNIQHAIAG